MTNDGSRRGPWPRRLLQGALVVAVAGGAAYYLLRSSAEGGPVDYRFASIERGTITNAVSSTGKVTAVGEVKLSSQLAGQIIEVLADYNTPVTVGQVLARLDPETFVSKVQQAEADLAIARASLVSNRASVVRSQSDIKNGEASLQGLQAQLSNSRSALESAERDLALQRELFARNVVAPKAVDDATTKHEQARANFEQITANIAGQMATQDGRRASLAQAQASITTAQAQVSQRDAQLASAKIDLERTVIKAPSSGTIIDRTAEVGQTIQNNTNTPLFTLAQDLRQMQIEVSVDEADIGKIQNGMSVKFSVDAFPGREFQGSVRQVRLAPKTVQNVVTYTVLAAAPNPDLSLLPGMTASARIIIEERGAALRIPNSALRYAPAAFQTPAPPGGGGGGPVIAGGGAIAVGPGGAPPPGAIIAGPGGGPGGGNLMIAHGGQVPPEVADRLAAAGISLPAAGGGNDAPAAAAGGGAKGGQGGQPRGGQGGQVGQAGGGITAQLAALDLSEAQQQQVQQAIAQARTQATQGGGTPQEIQQRLQQLQRAAVVAVLTPEQRTRFEAAEQQAGQAGLQLGPSPAAVAAGGGGQGAGGRGAGTRARAARVFVMGDDGKPKPVQVMIGVTDGGFTELVSGDLPSGARVIVGSNEAAPNPKQQGSALRMFGF